MDTAWKKRRRVFLLFLLGAILHVTPTISMPARNYTTSPPHKLNIDEYDPREHAVDDPEKVVRMFETATINTTTNRRKLSSSSVCSINNPMDSCWRCGKPHWRRDRRRLASCALGFGTRALGGLHGRFYYVHVSSDDDPSNPLRGSLRHAVIQDEPLWIVFTRDMTITLKQALVIKSHKTIDGRGNLIRIAKGGGLSLHYVRNVIVVGLTITDVVPTSMSDGDGISLCGATDVWIDHNTISRCADGLVDVIMGSTGITISNNHFSHHNEVMLLGHNDDYAQDKFMQVTIAFNRFGEGLIQRMPRCRHGYFHVVNNDYTHWEMYAIGGSAEPTINSQGNRFLAPANPFAKEVTKRVYSDERKWKEWNWRSEGDQFLNGAYFTASGTQGSTTVYARASSTAARPSSMVALLTLKAGNILCGKNHPHCS